MNPIKRWRWWALLALPLAVIVLNAFGPEGWREPLLRLLWLSWTAVGVAVSFSAAKAFADYAHGREAWLKALEHPIGAGLAFLGLCLMRGLLVLAVLGAAFAQYAGAQGLPAGLQRAQALAPVAVREIELYWPGMPRRSYLGALVEQETCPTLAHRYCWSPSARLKTSREEGAGLGQFTRAWTAGGALRFDALDEVRRMAPQALADLTWDSVYTRADLSLRAMLIKLRDCDGRLRALGAFGALERVAFCDAAYNGGWGAMMQDRKLCATHADCDAAQWFGHVERYSLKSRERWQGYGKSAFDINREHVRNTVPLESRRMKYLLLLGV